MQRLRTSAEFQLLAAMWRADRRLAAAWWALIVARGVLPAFFAVAMGAVVAAVAGDNGVVGALIFAGVVFVGMNALSPVHTTVGSILGAKAGVHLNGVLLRACVEPPGLAHLENPELADELAKAREFDAGIVGPPLEVAMPEVGSGFATILSGVSQAVVLGAYRWWAPIVLGAAWLSSHVFLRESALWRIFHGDEFSKLSRHSDYAFRLAVESAAAKEMRMFGLSGWVVDRYAVLRRKVADALYTQRKLKQRPLGWTVGTVLAGNAIVFWSLANDVMRTADPMPLSRAIVFAQVAVGCSALAFSEFDWWFRGSAEPIPRVLGLGDKMAAAGALASAGATAASMPSREITFEHVSFAYPTTGVQVLSGFDLSIPAGTSLAIVGPNGAGKTTLAKLLCRMYDPQSGVVRADGVDIKHLDIEQWRSRIAAVFQDFNRYELPLRDNVAPLGAPDDVIARALQRAQATDVAELDRVLSKLYVDGTDLSGGQWQRVALARAMCAVELGAGVIVLDEPTAQLDVRGEAEIFDRLLDATRGQTVVLISHRFSTVRHADRICVLEHGRVVELGSHDELMAIDGGRYRSMFELQASRFYVEEPEQEGVDAPA